MFLTSIKTNRGQAGMVAASPSTMWIWRSDDNPSLPVMEVAMCPGEGGWKVATTIAGQVVASTTEVDEGAAFAAWCHRLEVLDAAADLALLAVKMRPDQE